MDIRVGLHLGFVTAVASVLVAWNQVSVPKVVRLDADGAGTVVEIPSYASTIGQALFQADVGLKPGDDAYPSAERVLTPGLHVYVDRAKDVTVSADGLDHLVRTRVATVKDLLVQAGVAVSTADRVNPSLTNPV